jgi:hypothetical protein
MPENSPTLASLGSLPGIPDVAVARDAEEAALDAILQTVGPALRTSLRAALTGADLVATGKNKRTIGFAEGTTPEAKAQLQRYYAAQAHRIDEERRETAITNARKRGRVTVGIALGEPPGGSGAVVLRQPQTSPYDLIVLDPTAPIETLDAAFSVFREIRRSYGDIDDFGREFAVGVSVAARRPVDTGRRAYLNRVMRLQPTATTRTVDGIGTVKVFYVSPEELTRLEP